jgi:hypothetical protein
MSKTVKSYISDLTNPDTLARRLRDLELQILRELDAAGVEAAPSISNLKVEVPPMGQHAWLSWPREYQQPPRTSIISQLLDDGWSVRPISLVKWDNWRPTPALGEASEIPEVSPNGYRKIDATDVARMWLDHNYHTGDEAHVIMESRTRLVLRCKIHLWEKSVMRFVPARVERDGAIDWSKGGRLDSPEGWLDMLQAPYRGVDRAMCSWDGASYFKPETYAGHMPASFLRELDSLAGGRWGIE